VVVVALLLGGFFSKWYHIQWQAYLGDTPIDIYANLHLGLQSQTFTVDAFGVQLVNTETKWTDSSSQSHVKSIYQTCSAFGALAVIAFALLAVFSLLEGFVSACNRKGTKYFSVVLNVLGSICIMLALFVLFGQPNAINKDFHDYSGMPSSIDCGDVCHKFSGNQYFYKWGPEVGWYLFWAAFAVSLVVLCMIARHRFKHGYSRI